MASVLKLNKIHHIAIICSDYAVSKKFYTEILELEPIKETYRAARPSRPEACGLRHLAFEVDDIMISVDILKQKGVITEPVRTDELTGKRFAFFADPDGLPLELYET